MKKRAKSNSNISTLLTAFILIMLVALFIGAIYRSTDSFSQPIQTFYVEYDGDNLSNNDDFNVEINKEYKIKVYDTSYSIRGEKVSFNVKVYPIHNEDTSFEYKVDGNIYCFSYIEDISKGFVIVKDDGYFTLKATMDMQEILSLYYPNQEVTDCPTIIDSDISYIRLEIVSADGKNTMNINLKLKSE
ncbi:MAG: hypothetical protein IJA61_04050 [Clostridia bacterium]|nr:hypothetical protein [Clostridia bacterium]